MPWGFTISGVIASGNNATSLFFTSRWLFSLDVMQKIDLSTIFITHDIDEAILLSDRIYLMTGTPGKITHELHINPARSLRKEFNLTQEFLEYKRRIISILSGLH